MLASRLLVWTAALLSGCCQSLAANEDSLGMDEARLSVDVCASDGHSGSVVIIHAQNTNCWNCSTISILELHVTNHSVNGSAILYANHSTVLDVWLKNSSGHLFSLCNRTIAVQEHADYVLAVNINAIPANFSCLWQDGEGAASNMPILYAFIMLLGLWIVWGIILCAYRRRWHSKLVSFFKKNEMGSSDGLVSADLGVPSGTQQSTVPQPRKERFVALDVFRGISLTLMIFVNYGGGGYWFFSHSEWNGLTVADLLFPWFVFIMGMAVPLTQRSSIGQQFIRSTAFCKIMIRTIILFTLGLLVNSRRGNDLSTIRIMGVLQRLALSYLLVSLVGLVSPRPNLASHEGKWWSAIRDIVYFWPHLLATTVLLAAHIAISLFVSYDTACPPGYLGPGGLHDGGAYWNCTGGIAKYIDVKVLGLSHIYHYPTCKGLYQCTSHDPEGLLGTLTSAALCFLGAQAGQVYVCYKPAKSRMLRWFLWSLATGSLTLLLSKASQDDGWIPINKNLWSATFILGLASTAYLVLVILHFVIDVCGAWGGSPFYYAGVNSIAVYMGSEILGNFVPISFRVNDDHLSQLFMNIWSVAFFLLAAYQMYRKRLYISV